MSKVSIKKTLWQFILTIKKWLNMNLYCFHLNKDFWKLGLIYLSVFLYMDLLLHFFCHIYFMISFQFIYLIKNWLNNKMKILRSLMMIQKMYLEWVKSCKRFFHLKDLLSLAIKLMFLRKWLQSSKRKIDPKINQSNLWRKNIKRMLKHFSNIFFNSKKIILHLKMQIKYKRRKMKY